MLGCLRRAGSHVETRVLALLKKLGAAGRYAPLNAVRAKPGRAPPGGPVPSRRGAGGGGNDGGGGAGGREVPPKKRPHGPAAAAAEPEEAPTKKPRTGASKCGHPEPPCGNLYGDAHVPSSELHVH